MMCLIIWNGKGTTLFQAPDPNPWYDLSQPWVEFSKNNPSYPFWNTATSFIIPLSKSTTNSTTSIALECFTTQQRHDF